MRSDTLELLVRAPDRVAPGEPVPVTLEARNVSGRLLELHLRGREITFDLVVRDADGRTVWRRLEDEVVPGILRLEPLQADSVLRLGHVWDQRTRAGERIAPGAYTVRGELLTDGDPLVTPERPLRIGEG